MNMMLSLLSVLLLVGSLNKTVSGIAQDDAKPAAILDRISKNSPEGMQVIEKIKGLRPKVNERVSTKTLDEIIDEYAKNKGPYNITPIGWEASQKKPLPGEESGRWRIIFDYQDWEKQPRAAEWEYNADTNKLYPFEAQNAPKFWATDQEIIDRVVPVLTDSVQRSLAAFRGKIVILNFWATWCGPCRIEIPAYIALQNKYRDQGVEIVGVSIDPVAPRGERGGAPAVAPFMKDFGINYTVWMVDKVAALEGYDVSQGIPTTYVLDREGRIMKKNVGARSFAIYEDDIKQFLRIPDTTNSQATSERGLEAPGESPIPALIEALDNADQRLRYRAALALSGVRSGEERYSEFGGLPKPVIPVLPKQVVPILIDALKDQDPVVRSDAAWALAGIGAPAKAAAPALIESVEDRNLEVCRYAAYALKNVGARSPAVIHALIKLLKHPDRGIREVANEALVNIGEPAVPPLATLLIGQDSALRVKSHDVLRSIGDVFALVATLKSRDKALRSRVLEVIEDIRVDPARDSLASQTSGLLFDPSRKYLFTTVRIPCTYDVRVIKQLALEQ